MRPSPSRLFTAALLLLAAAHPLRAASRDDLSLRVVWNNPFDPGRGEVTNFEYFARGSDAPVLLRVYAVDGRLVRRLADHAALADTLYVQPWDGRNDDGDLVASGLYFVALDADGARLVRRVAVRKQ